MATAWSAALLSVIGCAANSSRVLSEPIATDRPDFTEGVATVAARHTQLETGMTFSGQKDTSSWAFGEVLIRQGLAKRLEGRVAINSFVVERDGTNQKEGLEDVLLSGKLSLRDAGVASRRWQPAVSALAGASVPTGSSAFRTPHVLPFVKLLTAWEISDRVDFSSNVNWAATEDDASIRSEWAASGSLGVDLTDRVGAYTEYFAIGTRSDKWRQLDYVNGGLSFRITPSSQIDARVGLGPFVDRAAFFAGVGFAYRW